MTYFVNIFINNGPNGTKILAKYHYISIKIHRQNNIVNTLNNTKNGFPNAAIHRKIEDVAYVLSYDDMYCESSLKHGYGGPFSQLGTQNNF